MRRPFRRLALRAFLALAGPVVAPDADTVLRAGVCPLCGIWECPDCRYLILAAKDHAALCGRRHLSHPGGQ